MKYTTMVGTSLMVLVAASACGETPPPMAPVAPEPIPVAAQPEADTTVESQNKDDDGSSGQVNIAADIRKACGITDAEALFAYDSSRVRQGDAPTLDKLATCFTSGALAGRAMRLVGHADPRGNEEYNLVLGGRRADSVKNYMVRAGLKDAQAQTTSRGEMDAQGTDAASWARDRRVDVMMGD